MKDNERNEKQPTLMVPMMTSMVISPRPYFFDQYQASRQEPPARDSVSVLLMLIEGV